MRTTGTGAFPFGSSRHCWKCRPSFIPSNRTSGQRMRPPWGEFPQLHLHPDEMKDFSDTAALIDAIDLVITVDTAAAHLAGAMGKPVWILLPWMPDWRWLIERSDSPWYPTATLFRQPATGDWGSVVGDICERLRRKLGRARERQRFLRPPSRFTVPLAAFGQTSTMAGKKAVCESARGEGEMKGQMDRRSFLMAGGLLSALPSAVLAAGSGSVTTEGRGARATSTETGDPVRGHWPRPLSHHGDDGGGAARRRRARQRLRGRSKADRRFSREVWRCEARIE